MEFPGALKRLLRSTENDSGSYLHTVCETWSVKKPPHQECDYPISLRNPRISFKKYVGGSEMDILLFS
jgi:hypothetical protein